MTTSRWALVVVALAIGGCKSERAPAKGGPAAAAPGAGIAGAPGLSTLAAAGGLALPERDVVGPSVTPIATTSLTFAVPRDDVTWVEMSFPCYAAASTMSSGGAGHPGAPIASVSPLVPVVMGAAGIDLDKDLLAIGGFACGDKPCLYIAAHLATPEKMKAGLDLIPGVDVTDHGGGHYSFAAGGASGPRDIHVRVVPVRWPGGKVAPDRWTSTQLAATHVIFLGGLFGGGDVDPLPLLQEPVAAAAKVKAVEGLVDDARGRCAIGTVAKQEAFKPGFDLDRARFVLALPAGKPDALTRLMASDRSVDLEAELTMTPAPTDADLARWTAESRSWIKEIADPVRAQFAGQGPVVEMVFEMVRILVEHGYRPTIAGNELTLSWRTDRVPPGALADLERRFQATMGTP